METKKLKTINIKGKEYVTVNTRVEAFHEMFPKGCIKTDLISPLESKQVVFRAVVTPDINEPERCFTGYSQAVIGEGMVNKTAAMENAETSAVGRALGFLGIGIVDSIASVDEIAKATYKPSNKTQQHLAAARGQDVDYSAADGSDSHPDEEIPF